MKNKYHILEICFLLFCTIIYSLLSITFNGYIVNAKVDAWLCPIIGSIIGIIPFSLYIYIINYEPTLNIHEKILKLFGNFFGKIINILFLISFSSLFLTGMYSLINFISSEYLYNTPNIFIIICFMFTMLYIFSKGFKVFCKSNIIFTFVAILLFLISLFGLIIQIKFSNVLPFLENGILGPIKGSIYHISNIVLPTFVILMIPKNSIINNKNYTKYLYLTYILTSIVVISVTFIVISTFGINLTLLYQYPVFHILKRVLISSVFERLESILAMQCFIYLFVALMFFLFYIIDNIEFNFNFKKFKFKIYIYYIIVICLVLLSPWIFRNNTLAAKIFITITPYIYFITFLLIPIIMVLKIKNKH